MIKARELLGKVLCYKGMKKFIQIPGFTYKSDNDDLGLNLPSERTSVVMKINPNHISAYLEATPDEEDKVATGIHMKGGLYIYTPISIYEFEEILNKREKVVIPNNPLDNLTYATK